MNILAACTGADSPVRKFIFKSARPLLRLRAGRPGLLHRGDAPAALRRAPRSSATSSRPRRRSPTSPRRTPTSTVTVLRCANVLGPDVDTGFTRMFSLPVVPMVLGFDPRLQFVHEDDIVHALEHAAFHDAARHLQRRRRRRPRALGGDRPARQARRCRCCRRGGPACSRGRCAGSGFRIPDEMLNLLRFGRGLDNRSSRRPASATATPRARP